MTSFTPGKPPASEVLSISQGFIKNNLDFLQQTGDVDHNFTGTSGVATNGYHKNIRLIAQALPVVNPNGAGQLFGNSANVTGGGVQLVYEDSLGKITQLTNATGASSAGNGYTFLPGGLIMNFGFVTTNFSGGLNPSSGTVKYTDLGQPAFGTNTRVVQTTMAGTSTTANIVEITAVDATTFKWKFTGGTGATSYTGFFWTAIGI